MGSRIPLIPGAKKSRGKTKVPITLVLPGNVRSTSANSNETTTKKPQKRSFNQSNEITKNQAGTSYDSIQIDNAPDEDVVVNGKRRKQDKSEEDDKQVKKSLEGSRICCPICFDSRKDKEISATACGHVFCTACITAAIATYRDCPICHKRLTKKKIYPLFVSA